MVNSQQLAAEYVTGACSGVNTNLLRFYRFAGRLPVSRDKFPFHGISSRFTGQVILPQAGGYHPLIINYYMM